ncbi:glycosyltransferase family 4 protein [Natrarchaeobius sp. A-rgal3]
MLLRLLSGLDTDEFRLIMLTQKPDETARQAEREGVELTIVPYRGKLDTYNGKLLDGSSVTKLRAGLRLCQFNIEARRVLSQADVLWVDEIRSYMTLLPYILFAQPTTIWNIGLLSESTGVMKFFHDIALRTTSYVFIESRDEAKRKFTVKQYQESKHKFVVFHKGVDTKKFSPHPSAVDTDSVRIGTAALIHPRKGLDDLLKAFSEIDRSNVELHIAGQPARADNVEYFNRLRTIIDDENLTTSVTFHGWVDDMPQFYSSLDLFVLPSYNEGIPGSVREAMAMELPVVATDVGATADVIVEGETGLLVEPGNVYELSNSIESLVTSPKKRKEMGIAGRKRIIDNFSFEQYVNNYDEFLTKIS